MRDSKNIDRIFQENLKDYEVFPPNSSWKAIENNLNGKQKKRWVPFWVKISSIAALLVLFFSVITIYFITESNITKNVLPKRNTTPKKIIDQDNLTNVVTEATATSVTSTTSNANNKVIQLNPKLAEKFFSTTPNKNFGNSANNEKVSDFQKSFIGFDYTNTNKIPFTGIAPNPHLKKNIAESKFTVATIFAPIYYNSFGGDSGIGEQFNNNKTSAKPSYSYGVKFSYKLNKKFTLQSGVHLISLGNKTNEVYLTPGVAVVGLSNISSLPILTKENSDLTKAGATINPENSASLNQVFGYIEIPVEIKYNITNGKIGVNIVGGISTLILNKDEIFIETTAFTQSLGSSNNLRDINFSGNFGVDVDYSIYKNLFINVTPMFKVQTNTFSKNNTGVQSYYLGIYTGLNYKF